MLVWGLLLCMLRAWHSVTVPAEMFMPYSVLRSSLCDLLEQGLDPSVDRCVVMPALLGAARLPGLTVGSFWDRGGLWTLGAGVGLGLYNRGRGLRVQTYAEEGGVREAWWRGVETEIEEEVCERLLPVCDSLDSHLLVSHRLGIFDGLQKHQRLRVYTRAQYV